MIEWAFPHSSCVNKEDFALYVYLYNPQDLSVDTDSVFNSVQIATNYDVNNKPIAYEKFNLLFCSQYESNDTVFYKYRVGNTAYGNKTLFSFITEKSGVRRYDISGFELTLGTNPLPSEFGVGGTYKFSGYSKGYGSNPNNASTLENLGVEVLDTIEIDIGQTYYRPNGWNNNDVHSQDTLNSIYFNIPNWVIEKYGDETDNLKGLQSVDCEWHEYKTKPIFVLYDDLDSKYFNEFSKYIGKHLSQSSSVARSALIGGRYYADLIQQFTSYDLNFKYGLGVNHHTAGYSNDYYYKYYDYVYNGWSNAPCYLDHINLYSSDFGKYYLEGSVNSSFPYMMYLFQADRETGIVPRSTFINYLNSFKANYYNTGLYDGNPNQVYSFREQYGDYYDIYLYSRFLPSVLFETNCDENRTRGYNRKIISREDLSLSLSSTEPTQAWWNIFGLHTTTMNYNCNTIDLITKSDFTTLSDNALCDKYYISSGDKSSISNSFTLDSNTYLLRFAVTDYTSYKISTIFNSDLPANRNYGYMAQQTVFLGFDTISVDFKKNGEYFTIPLAASPVDIVNDLTPPPTYEAGCATLDWGKIVAIILLLILLYFLYPYLPYIIKGLFWVLSLPIKLFKSIFGGVKEYAKSEKKNKNK